MIGKRVKVYWPLDKSWYEGSVKSFDGGSGKHLVQYDDAEEESLDLAKEKIEWIERSATKFRRLRRGVTASVTKMVIEEDGDSPENLEDDDEENGNGNAGGDDSSDEDWGKSAEKKRIEKLEKDSDDDAMEFDVEEEDKPVGKQDSRKRKVGEKKGIEKLEEDNDDGNDKFPTIAAMELDGEDVENVPLSVLKLRNSMKRKIGGEVKLGSVKKAKDCEDSKVSFVEATSAVESK